MTCQFGSPHEKKSCPVLILTICESKLQVCLSSARDRLAVGCFGRIRNARQFVPGRLSDEFWLGTCQANSVVDVGRRNHLIEEKTRTCLNNTPSSPVGHYSGGSHWGQSLFVVWQLKRALQFQKSRVLDGEQAMVVTSSVTHKFPNFPFLPGSFTKNGLHNALVHGA